MQTSEIMVINKIDTGTAFATTIEGNQGVFIPSKITALVGVQIGERFNAILIANTARPDKTPWMAIRIDRINEPRPAPKHDDLAAMIMADLRDGGSATVEDVADSIDFPVGSVVAKMQELARAGLIMRRTYYAINEADFDGPAA